MTDMMVQRRRTRFHLFTIYVCCFGLLAGFGLPAPVWPDSIPDYDRAGELRCSECFTETAEAVELLKKADKLYRQFLPKDSLVLLHKVLDIEPLNLEALLRTARAYIDVGDLIAETEPDWEERRMREYRAARKYARKAVEIAPESTWSHFYAAVSLAKIASLSSIKDQIAFAHEIRSQVEKSIELDPDNGFAYHLLGVWHRRMAEIGNMKRLVAFVFMQGSIPQGSMEKAVTYLRKAISYNPRVITHHFELAKTYAALGKYDLARKHLESVQKLPVRFSDDPLHKRAATLMLKEVSASNLKDKG